MLPAPWVSAFTLDLSQVAPLPCTVRTSPSVSRAHLGRAPHRLASPACELFRTPVQGDPPFALADPICAFAFATLVLLMTSRIMSDILKAIANIFKSQCKFFTCMCRGTCNLLWQIQSAPLHLQHWFCL